LSELKNLKEGNQQTQFQFYDRHKSAFLMFGNKFELPKVELIEVYQDACLVVFENAVLGKLDHVQSSLQSYLFGVAKFLIYKRFRNAKRLSEIDLSEAEEAIFFEPFEDELQNPRIDLIRSSLGKMGKKCRQILTLFYFEEKDLDDIMTTMAYESKNVLKSQKSRCLKQLKEMIQDNE
jgi:RNA polymerase sigma factor (sigma-70 family)